MRYVLLYLRIVLSMHEDILCIDDEIFSKYGFIIDEINVLIRKKYLRLTMGFRYLMYSHSLVPVIDL